MSAVSTYGRLAAAFNNAASIPIRPYFWKPATVEFERVMSVNLRGVWNCMKGKLRKMTVQGSGAIVNCSSIGGLKGSRGCSVYFGAQLIRKALAVVAKEVVPSRC